MPYLQIATEAIDDEPDERVVIQLIADNGDNFTLYVGVRMEEFGNEEESILREYAAALAQAMYSGAPDITARDAPNFSEPIKR